MKVWKLVSGILSIVIFAIVAFQSCAAGVVDAVQDADGTGGGAGVVVAVLLLTAGIVSIVGRNSTGKAFDITLVILYGLAALVGYTLYGVYSDLQVWATWCLVCAILAIVSMVRGNSNKPKA